MPVQRPITMEDIAKLANVSKPTVSRALSNSPLVNKATRAHVLEVAQRHGYAVNRNAQKLRQKRTNTISVSMDFNSYNKNHISDPFMFDLLAGISEALGKRNQDLLLCAPSHNDIDSFRQIYQSRGADGFMFLGQGHREELLDELALTNVPFVVWGAPLKNTKYCVVGSDNFLGGKMAGDYLISQNRKSFLFIGDISHSEIAMRYRGLKASIDSSGEHIRLVNLALSSFSYESALEATAEYLESLESMPDAIFAYSDTAAMAFISALGSRGLRVPQDISVIGYNDIPSASFFNPRITTIRQDTHLAGELMVNKLLQLLEGESPSSETIETELVVRET